MANPIGSSRVGTAVAPIKRKRRISNDKNNGNGPRAVSVNDIVHRSAVGGVVSLLGLPKCLHFVDGGLSEHVSQNQWSPSGLTLQVILQRRRSAPSYSLKSFFLAATSFSNFSMESWIYIIL